MIRPVSWPGSCRHWASAAEPKGATAGSSGSLRLVTRPRAILTAACCPNSFLWICQITQSLRLGVRTLARDHQVQPFRRQHEVPWCSLHGLAHIEPWIRHRFDAHGAERLVAMLPVIQILVCRRSVQRDRPVVSGSASPPRSRAPGLAGSLEPHASGLPSRWLNLRPMHPGLMSAIPDRTASSFGLPPSLECVLVTLVRRGLPVTPLVVRGFKLAVDLLAPFGQQTRRTVGHGEPGPGTPVPELLPASWAAG